MFIVYDSGCSKVIGVASDLKFACEMVVDAIKNRDCSAVHEDYFLYNVRLNKFVEIGIDQYDFYFTKDGPINVSSNIN